MNARRLFLGEALREHNPLSFDFSLKRLLVSEGQRFSPAVFATRRIFAASST